MKLLFLKILSVAQIIRLTQSLECIRLILKFTESFNCIVTNPKFPRALRLCLGSHKTTLRYTALTFLVTLLSKAENDIIAVFLYDSGILGMIALI